MNWEGGPVFALRAAPRLGDAEGGKEKHRAWSIAHRSRFQVSGFRFQEWGLRNSDCESGRIGFQDEVIVYWKNKMINILNFRQFRHFRHFRHL